MTTTKTERVAQAEAEAERLGTVVEQCRERHEQAVARLAELDADAGHAALRAELDGSDQVKTIAGRVARARAEVETLEAMIEAAKQEKELAARGVRVARAADLRDEARTLRAEVDDRQPRTDELLAQLEEYEGVRYVPEPPPPTPLLVQHDGTPLKGGAPRIVTVRIPRTEWLRAEATRLEQEALVLEHGPGPSPTDQRRHGREPDRAA